MPQTPLLPPNEPNGPSQSTKCSVDAPLPPGRSPWPRRTFAPIGQAHGIPAVMLRTGFAIIGFFVLAALFAPLLAPYAFDQHQSGGADFPTLGVPDGRHLFGTTAQGLDVLSRTIYGARTALGVTVLAVICSLVIGVPLGLLGGYFGGWFDRVLVLVTDALRTFPHLLLAVVAGFVFSGLLGGGVLAAALSITVVFVPRYVQVVRSATLSAGKSSHVRAARAMGARSGTVIRAYLFGDVIRSVPAVATVSAADAISTLAGLGFLGLGIQPTDAAEWGYDLQRAIDDVNAGMWWTALFPGIALILAILGFTLVGEGLNDVLNTSMRHRRIGKISLPAWTGTRRVVAATTESAGAAAIPDTPKEV